MKIIFVSQNILALWGCSHFHLSKLIINLDENLNEVVDVDVNVCFIRRTLSWLREDA